jgi:hypothetical protein
MKKRLTIALAATLLAATTSFVAAGSNRHQVAGVSDILSSHQATLPAHEMFATVRALGFAPTTEAFRRGPYYVLHARDRYGFQVQVVADAQLGDIVSIAQIYVPQYDAGPRIIHVPQPVSMPAK